MIPLKDDNPTRHPPYVTIAIIAINLVVYLWQISAGPLDNLKRDFRYSMVPVNLMEGHENPAVLLLATDQRGAIQIGHNRKKQLEDLGLPQLREQVLPGGAARFGYAAGFAKIEIVEQTWPAWLTILSSMFMHGSWMHLLGNMLFLWVFGNNIEDATRRLRFLAFYLVTGALATLTHALADTGSMIPTLGASGAISGILGGYLVLYPKARVLALVPIPPMFITTMRLPAALFLMIWFVIQLSGLMGDSGGVAWWAHLGGFVAGAALVKLMETTEHRERPPSSGFQRGWQRRSSPNRGPWI